jgi:hypothetical protein
MCWTVCAVVSEAFSAWSADGAAVFIEERMSVTLEVPRHGLLRWFVTKESGELPRCMDADRCGCDDEKNVAGGAGDRRVAYAIVNIGRCSVSSGRGFVERGGKTLFAVLCGSSMSTLVGIWQSVVGVRAGHCWTERGWYVARWTQRLLDGWYSSEGICECDMRKCTACSNVAEGGGVRVWIHAERYIGLKRRRKQSPWFSEVTDGLARGTWKVCATAAL